MSSQRWTRIWDMQCRFLFMLNIHHFDTFTHLYPFMHMLSIPYSVSYSRSTLPSDVFHLKTWSSRVSDTCLIRYFVSPYNRASRNVFFYFLTSLQLSLNFRSQQIPVSLSPSLHEGGKPRFRKCNRLFTFKITGCLQTRL